jgi:MoaA/NifB/PqqE/SkfB family radical SAM enzyme
MSSQKIHRISLCGGEPFLFVPLRDVISFATTKNIRCSITSNGMTIHRLEDEDFAAMRANNADINLSIDSFEEEIQAFTRGTPSALENALKSIDRLKREQIPFTVLAAISRYNYRNLSGFVETAHRIGIRQVLFQPIIHYTNYPDRPVIGNKASLNVPEDEIDTLLEELQKIYQFEKGHDISTNVYRIRPWIRTYLEHAGSMEGELFFREVLGKFYCRETFATIDIAYDGGIQPCGLTGATVNIHDRQGRGLLELWQEATAGIRDSISQGHYYPYCNACCHKFSRNMMASIMRYPWKNRKAAARMAPLIFARIVSKTRKQLSKVK